MLSFVRVSVGPENQRRGDELGFRSNVLLHGIPPQTVTRPGSHIKSAKDFIGFYAVRGNHPDDLRTNQARDEESADVGAAHFFLVICSPISTQSGNVNMRKKQHW